MHVQCDVYGGNHRGSMPSSLSWLACRTPCSNRSPRHLSDEHLFLLAGGVTESNTRVCCRLPRAAPSTILYRHDHERFRTRERSEAAELPRDTWRRTYPAINVRCEVLVVTKSFFLRSSRRPSAIYGHTVSGRERYSERK